ncbi:S8 family peptidase [Haladaptatus halobius]|uniref:S8 family peptidase n=1 Tax=Haladaptatus halobius TaxID=2884875 RepID=UPI001D0ADA88|nr:S8 family peptidase [Haladaptatus halobius]
MKDSSRREILKKSAGIGIIPLGLQRPRSCDQPLRVIVGTESESAIEAAHDQAETVRRTIDLGSFSTAVVGRFSKRARTKLRNRCDVTYVEQDRFKQAIDHETTGSQTLPWGIDRIDAEQAHHKGYTGSGADIAIIDTGIDSDHQDLQPNLGAGKAYISCGTTAEGNPCTQTNGNACRQPWDDDDNHGTHVAGTTNAVNNSLGVIGVSTEATLHAVKALDCTGSGYYSQIAAGIRYVADQGWDVAVMSLGSPIGSRTIHDACKYAYRRGVFLVAAAGNDGCLGCVNYPAAYPEVIAVSATTPNDRIASFSSTGSAVELAAPGANVYSTVAGGYATFSGASMACPHVGGAAAQLMALGDTNATNITYDSSDTLTEESYENPGGARGRLRSTAESIGLDSTQQGYGLVDVEAAVSIGETGTVTTNQPTPGAWHTVSLEGAYDNPIVLMQPLSYNGSHPCHIRLRNVQRQSFEFQLEEWAYLDGTHTAETISYLVLDAGTYTSETGTRIEVGTMTTNHTFSRKPFSQNFTTAPVVLTQTQTFNGPHPIVTRQRNVSSNETVIRLQEEEAQDTVHATETVGYIAAEPGVSELNTVRFEAGLTPNTVTQTWHSTEFDRLYEEPIFIADMQTYDGGDPAALRYRNLRDSTVDVRIEEEQSRDAETNHTTEALGYFVIDGQQLI